MRKASLSTIFLIVFIDLMGFGIVLPNLQLYGLRLGIKSYFTLTLLGACLLAVPVCLYAGTQFWGNGRIGLGGGRCC